MLINGGFNSPQRLTPVGETLFFTGDAPGQGRELWALDASSTTPRLVKDIDPTIVGPTARSSEPSQLTSFNGKLYFSAEDPDHGRELWMSDGTTEGTVIVSDLNPGAGSAYSSSPYDLTVAGNNLFFIAEDPTNGEELRRLDAATNELSLVADLEEGPQGSFIVSLTAVGNSVYFHHNDNFHDLLATNAGYELWFSDGTPEGTRLVADVNPGPEDSRCFNEFLGPSIVPFADGVAFRASNFTHGCELWYSDGTSEGTTMLADIFEDTEIEPDVEGESSDPDELFAAGDSLFFRANNENGIRIWEYELDEGGGGTLKRGPAADPFHPADFTVVGPRLVFAARDSVEGTELFSLNLEPTFSVEVAEVLAKDVAYRDWTVGNSVSFQAMGYGRVAPLSYTVDQFFQDTETGFDAVGLVSDNGLGPVLAVRGSVAFLTDWFDDFHPDGVGTNQFLANFASVEAWLNSVATPDVKPSIVGHSLGGALTQLIASQYTENGGEIDKVITFNSPAINQDYAQAFRPDRVDEVTHYITNGDPVSMAGEQFIEGKWVRATFSAINLITNHTHPVVVPFTFAGDATRNRPSDTEFEFYETTDWLSDPYYFHTDLDYLTWVTAAYAVTNSFESLRPYRHLPASLLFRSTTEAQRQTIGQVWHDIQSPVLTLLGSSGAPCRPDLEPITVADIDFNLLGLLEVEATDLMASCRVDPEPGIWLQGEVRLPDFFNVTANFTDDNRIQLFGTNIDVVGTVTAESIPIVPRFLEVEQAAIGIDTIDNTLEALAKLDIKPWGVDLDVGLGFLNNEWNSISIGLAGLNLTIPFLPGGVLQRISGDVDHIAESDPAPIAFGGSIGMTLGPEITVNLPSWAGGPVTAKLLGFDGGASFDRHHLEATADLSILNDLATVDGMTQWNWTEGTVTASGGFDILDGLIVSDNASFSANAGDQDDPLNISASASATFSVPSVIPLIGGATAFSGDFFLQFTDDSNLGNDSTGAYAGVDLPLVGETGLGFRIWFNGGFGLIGADEIAELVPAGEGESTGTSSANFTVEAGEQWILFSADWQNATGNQIVLTTPSGETLTETDIANNPDMSLVESLSSSTRRVVIVSAPEAGNWQVSVDSDTATGPVSYFAGASNIVPSGQITQLTAHPGQVDVAFVAMDPDNQATVSLYYDSDASGFDGILLGSVTEDDGADTFLWNTSAVSGGEYYVYMVIDDGVNAPTYVYSGESVSVTQRQVSGEVWNDVNANGMRDSGEVGVPDVAVYLDANDDSVLDEIELVSITGDDGTYRFNQVPDSNQIVRIVVPAGFVQSSPPGNGSQIAGPQDQVVVEQVNFGVRVTPAEINGIVWQDLNRDGFRDDSEAVRDGTTVRILDVATEETIHETQTDASGHYQFLGIVPGSYFVQITTDSIDAITTNDRRGSDRHDSNVDPQSGRRRFDLLRGEVAQAIDVGLYSAWNNFSDRYDVNQNGEVSPTDALVVINFLGRLASGVGGQQPAPDTSPDVSGNSEVSPLDALLVINELARRLNNVDAELIRPVRVWTRHVSLDEPREIDTGSDNRPPPIQPDTKFNVAVFPPEHVDEVVISNDVEVDDVVAKDVTEQLELLSG